MTKPARWMMQEVDPSAVSRLEQELRIQAPAARVLVARGFEDAGSARRFLQPSLDDLVSPFEMRDMDRAAGRLLRACREHEKILLYGDYDVDGTTSVVILKKAIELAGGQASFHVPHRLRDGYGMRPEVVEQAAAEGVRLIISVDTGIRAIEVVRHGNDLGIDIIVTDHHLPESELPPALAVLNPNRPDCGYPEKNLCGAGVALKLAQALFRELDWSAEKQRRMMDSFLKLAAIATVADVVPLTGENRVIVKRGLEGLREVRNPGLRALLGIAGFQAGDSPSAGQVAFRLAPRINAAGRMASAMDAIEMFLTSDDSRARQLAEQLHSLNTDRQAAEAEVVQTILAECESVPVSDDQAALVFAGTDWHRGVLGIVASRLVERFCRPAFVLSFDEASGMMQGSGRSVRGFHLLEALESMAGLFTRFGGHRQAAGVTLLPECVGEFRGLLSAYAGLRLSPDDFRRIIDIDATLELQELTDRSAAQVLALAPFGCGNPAPVFVVRGAQVCDAMAWKDRHAQVRLAQNGRALTMKAWDFAPRLAEMPKGTVVDVAVCVEEDAFSSARGFPGWCVTLRDVRPASAMGLRAT